MHDSRCSDSLLAACGLGIASEGEGVRDLDTAGEAVGESTDEGVREADCVVQDSV